MEWELEMQEENSKNYKASGLKSTLHGTVYQLKLLMLFLQRGLNEKYSFRLFTELIAAEKFDDLVFQYEKDNKVFCRFLQAKHSRNVSKKITANDLFAEEGRFSLRKYFTSYQNIRKNKDFEGMEKDFVICTNIDIENSLQSCFQQVDDESHILKPNNEKSRLLKFNINQSPIYKELAEKLKSCSDIGKIATALARWATKDQLLALRNSHVFNLHLSTLREIIEVNKSKRIKTHNGVKIKIYATFREEFLKGNLEGDLNKVLNIRKAFCEAVIKMSKNALNEEQVWVEMKEKKLNLSSTFAKKLEESATSEVSLPDISDKDIEDFFKNLIFAVNQPNEEELNIIIETEISEGKDFLNMITTPIVANKFQKHMLDWMKEKGNVFLTHNDGISFFREATNKLCQLSLSGQYLKSRAIIKNFDIAFNEKIPELRDFLLPSSKKQIFNLINPHKPELTSIKVVSILDSIEQYKKDNSFIFISSKSLMLIKDLVINSFKVSPLLVIQCKSKPTEGNILQVFDELSREVKNSENKKIILITEKDDCLANKFKDEFHPDKYDEKDDYSNCLIDLTSESQEKLLSKAIVQFQGKNVSLQVLIDDEGKKLIDGEILFKLIKGEKIEVGIKRPGLHDLESIYHITSVNIDKQQLSSALEKNKNDLFVFVGINREELSQIIPDEDSEEGKKIYLFGEDILISENKYVILTDDEDEEKCIENFKQVCGDYSRVKTNKKQFSAYLIRKRDDKLTWIRSYNPSLYIKRKFHQIVINIKSLRNIIKKVEKEKVKRDIFVINNIKIKKFKDYYDIKVSHDFTDDKWSNEKNHVVILNNKNKREKFEIFCNQENFKMNYNVHWLQNKKGSDKNYLIWRRTEGEGDKIKELKETENINLYIDEKDLRTEKATVIAGDPGIGKSTTLAYLVGQPNESEWIIKLDLINFEKQLSKLNNIESIDSFIESFFSKINIGIEGKFAKSLFKYKIVSQGKITFLFDGFDEITAKSQETVIKLLKLLKNSKANFRIATRLHDEGKLEKCLSMPSYTFKLLTPQDQQHFFYKFRKIGLKFSDVSDDKIVKSAETLYKKIKNADWKVMCIPLMMRMFADIYQEAIEELYNCDNEEEFQDIQNLSMCNVYERFIRRNYEIYFKEKAKVDNMPDYMKDKLTLIFNKDHQHLALRKLFPDYAKILTDKYELLSADDKKYFTSVGIAKADSRKSDLYFTHQTFAEYFVARLLVRIIKKTNDHPKYMKACKFLLIEIFENKYKLIIEFIDEIAKKENLESKWKEIKDCDLVKTREQRKIISLVDEASDSSLCDLQESVDIFFDGTTGINDKKIRTDIESFVHRFLQKTEVEQLKNDLNRFLKVTEKQMFKSLNEAYLMDKVSTTVMHYFNQSKRSDVPVEKQFKNACIERVIGKVFSNYNNVFKKFKESSTGDNLQQLTDLFIPSKEKNGIEPVEWIKLNNFYCFLEIFHPDVINSIKSYINSKIIIRKRYAERVLSSLQNTKFPRRSMINTFVTPWNLTSLQSLFLHIINNPKIIPNIKTSINEIFKNQGRNWLEKQGIFIFQCLQILTDTMSKKFISVLSEGNRTAAYSECLLQYLLNPIVDTLRKKELPHIDKIAFMDMLEKFFSLSVKYDVSILLTRKQFHSMLQFVENLINWKHQNDRVLNMISNYMISLGTGGLKVLGIEKNLTAFDPTSEFQYDLRSRHAGLVIGRIRKIRNRTEPRKNVAEKSFIKAESSAPGQKRKSPGTNLTESKRPRVEVKNTCQS